MKNTIKNLILPAGILVLFTHTANARWVQGQGMAGQGVSALAVSGSNIFAGANRGVFLSANNGASWTVVDTSLGANCFAVVGGNIFAGTYGGGVYLSTNNGASWTAVDSGLTDLGVISLAAGSSDIFAGTASYGVFRSTNNGTSWTADNSGLPANPLVRSFAVSGSNIFAGTIGVYLSTDNGARWAAVDSGLPVNTHVTCLAVSGNTVFAGVGDSGVWYRPLSEMTGAINPKPQNGMSMPYASGFKINIRKNGLAVLLPETLHNGAVAVELVNLAGRRIYSAAHQACNGSLNIPVSGLSTGGYLMSIRGSNTAFSSPFVVTK
jgi:hypothetical protein